MYIYNNNYNKRHASRWLYQRHAEN